jgi:hypothetical protein
MYAGAVVSELSVAALSVASALASAVSDVVVGVESELLVVVLLHDAAARPMATAAKTCKLRVLLARQNGQLDS